MDNKNLDLAYRRTKMILRLTKIAKRTLRLLRKPRLIKKKVSTLKAAGRVYKLAYGGSARLMAREFLAESLSRDAGSVWADLGVFYRPLLAGKHVVLCSATELPRRASISEVNRTLQDLLDRIPETAEYVPWNETLETDRLGEAMESLSRDQRRYVEDELSGLLLPVTGAHGDLVDHNVFVEVCGSVRVIDWEYFRENGTVVTDVLRCVSFRNAKQNSLSQHDASVIERTGLPLRLPWRSFQRVGYHGAKRPAKVSLSALSLLAAVTNVTLPVVASTAANRAKRLAASLEDMV